MHWCVSSLSNNKNRKSIQFRDDYVPKPAGLNDQTTIVIDRQASLPAGREVKSAWTRESSASVRMS
eukprot:m.292000 g.292000  ORF g.292000 m.292000 type:complete len:66 (-) comp55103_c0_seq4:219-416(-)